ncbi:gamma-glutamyltransferase [Methylosinus sp. Sm6]|uniref:gamma-glutamyltransferase n=1 Tax=Methylosinus sp. Sm6 TaxID=2866948 RepID=UPI001C99781F|nr:gamma-glutamyltransferase [Methylosinus sp. Sm6]MBY6239897.1 gamma-glutamyltransferase [Methylosinus sp. Sm6]
MQRLLAAALLLLVAYAATAEPVATGRRGMVVTEHRLASEVGLSILKAGGNAVDAAVAVGYALAVVHPCCGNLGGGGFLLLHRADGEDRFVNFRESAPAAATADMFLDPSGEVVADASRIGFRAVAVPGTVLGLETAREHYGRLPRESLIAPAIALAEQGFVLEESDLPPLRAAKRLKDDPAAATIFFRPDGSPLQAGDRLVQSDLARLLREIAARGPRAFYEGRVPQAIERAATAANGVVSAEDFARYRVEEREPVRCAYRGYAILSSAPPSSGGVALCEILNILEGYDLAALGFHAPRSLHLLIEAERHAFKDRNLLLGDPAFVRNPVERLTSKTYAAEIRARISPERATPSADLATGAALRERPETTHYSILDGEGSAVAVTYTLNGSFGAQVMAPETGVLLNDEMDDFAARPGASNGFRLVQGSANAIAPGKRPLSSMSPTIVTKDGKVVLVLGSPNGPRIISVTLQALLDVVDHRMSLEQAVAAPRIHHQWLPDVALAEPGALTPQTRRRLEEMGHQIEDHAPFGACEAIGVVDGVITGVNDPRSPAGAARGY